MKNKIIKDNQISYDNYNITEKVRAVNGSCERIYLFSPDGEYCYKCDDELVGMPGCREGCNFSLKRNRILKCDSGCKTGYIESSEGVCSSCSAINKGCHECHYENDYPLYYEGIQRKRRFVCDYCEEGYFQFSSGECKNCQDIGLNNCLKCELDSNDDNYKCIQCQENYFIDDYGECQICDDYHCKGLNSNKCIICDNILEGGIDKCLFCESTDGRIICNQCKNGYILLTNNNSCLEISKNKELENFFNCDKLTMEDNKLMCSKCKSQYTLVKINNVKKCIYLRTLYDINFNHDYEYNFYFNQKKEIISKGLEHYQKNDYLYKRFKEFYPCQEAENLGSEDNPIYSCIKCYDYLGQHKNYVKISEQNTNLSYCFNPGNYYELKNCEEANHLIKNGKEYYNCTKCNKNYILTLNKLSETFYCQHINISTKCLVLYCKKCNSYDNYICDECFPDYEVNSHTGYCTKKTELVPAITWKDIYRLKLNHNKYVHNRYITGPYLRMRGITSSQINTRHGFLIYLIFELKHSLRNLEEKETLKIPTICEVLEEVDKTDNDVNMVEYECVGNMTNITDENLYLTNYKLENIEEGNNENILKNSNLNELVSEIKEEIKDL